MLNWMLMIGGVFFIVIGIDAWIGDIKDGGGPPTMGVAALLLFGALGVSMFLCGFWGVSDYIIWD